MRELIFDLAEEITIALRQNQIRSQSPTRDVVQETIKDFIRREMLEPSQPHIDPDKDKAAQKVIVRDMGGFGADGWVEGSE